MQRSLFLIANLGDSRGTTNKNERRYPTSAGRKTTNESRVIDAENLMNEKVMFPTF